MLLGVATHQVARVVQKHFLSQGSHIDMGVYLCGTDMFVSKHALYGSQVGSSLEQRGGKRVAEGMGTDGFVDAILLGEFFHDKENHLACEACASAVEEDGVGEFGFGRDM